MTKVLMVCLGNICRSPLAEGILQFKVDASKVQVDSAGMQGYHVGELPDKRSIKVAGENLIDITDQRARLFQVSDFDTYDFIYAMDTSVYKNLIEKASSEKEKTKVKLILNEVFPDENMDVPDPYHSSLFAFRNVYTMLDEACDIISKDLE
ncbi:MAG TPA: low molecular weight phosphotyrosine protein phosphatase [Lutibacter sp.]|nr:low molecular weight phosphotyrosine protein phosphatase [Lutibacter sp.]